MIADYESGTAPSCAPGLCLHGEACRIARYECAQLQAGNHLLGLCWESACVVAKIHDPEKRAYIAGALADSWPDIMPDGWFDEDDFLEACGVARVKAVVA